MGRPPMAGLAAAPALEGGGGGRAAAQAAPAPPDSASHAFWSATLTLTLAILGRCVAPRGGTGGCGCRSTPVNKTRSSPAVHRHLSTPGALPPALHSRSSVLPLPFVFSRLGVAPGLAVMLAVALGNALAGTLLLRAAGALDRHSYEGLAEAVGGPSWKVRCCPAVPGARFRHVPAGWQAVHAPAVVPLGTPSWAIQPPARPRSRAPPRAPAPRRPLASQVFAQAALVLLLAGNIIGDFCLLADMGVRAARQLFPGAAGPGPWLAAAEGRAAAAALGVAVVFPLSCLRRMRQVGGIAGAATCSRVGTGQLARTHVCSPQPTLPLARRPAALPPRLPRPRRAPQLERAGASGFLFVLLLAAVIARYSLAEGLPALASGELPLWRPALPSGAPEAVGVLSFA